MNELTEQNMNEAIDWLQQRGSEVEAFALEQAPLYCQEVVAYQFWSHSIPLTIGVLVLFLAIYCTQFVYKNAKHDEQGDKCLILAVVGLFSFITGITMFGCNIHQFTQSIVAPRMVVMEHISKLLN